jgi:cupredoxin-like protein
VLKRLTSPVLALALVLALTACGGGDPGGFGSTPPPGSSPSASGIATSPPDPGPGRVIRVSTPGLRYEPAVLVLPVDEPVILELVNDDDELHALTVDALSLQMTAGPGETVRLPFEAPQRGSFTMYCSISGHRAAGHTGRIRVR